MLSNVRFFYDTHISTVKIYLNGCNLLSDLTKSHIWPKFFVDLWLEKFQNWDLICDLIQSNKKLKFSYHHQFQVNRREMSYHCFPLEKEIWKEIIWKNLSIFWPDIKTSTESIYKRNIYWTGWEMKMWILELHLEFLAVF